MFTNSNLSFEAAPPINVVLRFFLTGTLFAIIMGVTLFFNFKTLSNIYDPITVTIVHLFTLGVVSNFLLGALFQMLPVIAGVSIANSQVVAMRVHYSLLLGIIFLLSAFLKGAWILYLLASFFLGFSFLYTAFVALKELLKIKHSPSSRGMMYTLFSFIFLIFFAFILIALKNGLALDFNFLEIRSLHFSFGVFGIFMLLIFSVSFQVIEMFYVTPPYPKKYAQYLASTLFAILLLFILFPWLSKLFYTLIALIAFSHAFLTVKLLRAKKRAVSDVTIWLWYFAMANLIVFAFMLIATSLFTISTEAIALFFSFFLLGTIIAMVFKIVPFLVWFQLNRQGYFDGPMMHEVIHPKVAKRVFYLFLASYGFFLFSLLNSFFSYFASILFIVTFITLFILIYLAWQKYLYTLKHGMKLDFPSNI